MVISFLSKTRLNAQGFYYLALPQFFKSSVDEK